MLAEQSYADERQEHGHHGGVVVAACSIVFEAVETAYEEGTRWLAAQPAADAGEV